MVVVVSAPATGREGTGWTEIRSGLGGGESVVRVLLMWMLLDA
jgi:hypothetical protein